MLGRDHSLSGAVAFAVIAPPALHPTFAQLAAGTVLTAGAALLSDLDEPGSTIAREAGFLGRGFAKVVRKASGGHRKGTHSAVGVTVFTGAALLAVHYAGNPVGRAWLALWLALLTTAALQALPAVRGHVPDVIAVAAAAGMTWWSAGLHLVPWCVAIGMVAHIAGDALTHHGVPVAYPFWKHDFHVFPVQFTTGKFFERAVMEPLLIIGLAAALAWDMGIGRHLAW